MNTEKLTLTVIAKRIRAHLARFEAEPEITNVTWTDGKGIERTNTRYWNTRAFKSGIYVAVTYVSYQGTSFLKKPEALAYLEWLDAGNVGKHFDVEGEA